MNQIHIHKIIIYRSICCKRFSFLKFISLYVYLMYCLLFLSEFLPEVFFMNVTAFISASNSTYSEFATFRKECHENEALEYSAATVNKFDDQFPRFPSSLNSTSDSPDKAGPGDEVLITVCLSQQPTIPCKALIDRQRICLLFSFAKFRINIFNGNLFVVPKSDSCLYRFNYFPSSVDSRLCRSNL